MNLRCIYHVLHRRQRVVLMFTLRKCLYIVLCVSVVLIVYKVICFKYKITSSYTSYVNMTNRRGRKIYSNEGVYMAIKQIRFNNCLNKYANDICADLQSCEALSELKTLEGCDNTIQCRSRINETKVVNLKCKRRLPGAIIIGTYKSGTRELIDFLAMNPLVVIKRQPNYEVAYFDKNAGKGLDWYRNAMPFSCQGQITIEKSPSYFTSLEAPRRIHKMNKNIKLILIVRNPSDRTLSHLTYEHFIIKEQFKNDIYNCLYKYTFNRRIINENCFAVKDSFYDSAMERFLKYFSSEQIHIIDADAFLKNPCDIVKDVEHFLQIDTFINCDKFFRNNDTGFVCAKTNSTDLGFCYEKTRGRVKLQSKFPVMKTDLQKLFKSHNERFFSLVGKRFDW